MSAFLVVKPFNIVKDISAQLIAGAIVFSAKPFCLQSGEETFHSGVVPTVSAPTHAAYDAVRFEQPLRTKGVSIAFFLRNEATTSMLLPAELVG